MDSLSSFELSGPEVFKKAVELAAFSRSVCDRISLDNITDRSALGIYYCAKLALEHKDALIITGFDGDGRIMREEIFVCKPLTDHEKAKKRISSLLSGTVCPYYAAARKTSSFGDNPDQEKIDESESLFKVLWYYGYVLEEYVTVKNFEFSLLSRRFGKRFPDREGNTVFIKSKDWCEK